MLHRWVYWLARSIQCLNIPPRFCPAAGGPAVALVFVGQGPEKRALQRRARQTGLENTVFLPPVPKTSMPALLTSMDACFIGWNRKPIYRFGVSPNKLFDYMMAGRPVIRAIE